MRVEDSPTALSATAKAEMDLKTDEQKLMLAKFEIAEFLEKDVSFAVGP